MKNIKEFINESKIVYPITKSNKKIVYPNPKRSCVCTGIILRKKGYDKLLNELGEPEENINNFVKFAWTCRLWNNTFLLFSSYDRKLLENSLKRDGFISLDIWGAPLSMDDRIIIGEQVVKYFDK